MVVGGSGSGMSSLLRAGVLPHLNTQRIHGGEGHWYTAEFRPRTDPLGELVHALVDQCLLPLLDLKQPALVEKMRLLADVSKEQAKSQLRADMWARFFDGASAKPLDEVFAALLEFVGELNEFDRLASRGLRASSPSLVLLLDQFEEVFRPEVPLVSRYALLDLIVGLRTMRPQHLFLALTMRSDELHRCTEHRGLSEVSNRCSLFPGLMDGKDLHSAIVQPARNVFDDWGLEYDRDCSDAPFAPGMVDWLLAGAERSSNALAHRPDMLPLLQHALQATWHCAMRRWSDIDADVHEPTIERKDLPGQGSESAQAPDLGACLRVRADKAVAQAAKCFAAVGGISEAAGEAALQAAFRALARRTDRMDWTSRFAEPEEMESFIAADRRPDFARLDEDTRSEALRQALHVFLLRGYLSGGNGRPYEISHDALIRNWPKFLEWLKGPEEVAHAFSRVLREVDPNKFRNAGDVAKAELIPKDVANKIAMMGSHGVPASHVWSQIENNIGPATQWGGKEDTLQKVVAMAKSADEARRRLAKSEKSVGQRPRDASVKVFISYRREDSRHAAGRIYDTLVRYLPKEKVFIDIDSIPPGLDFVEVLEHRIEKAEMVLALIGDGWSKCEDPKTGQRRLDNPQDFVRVEISAALSRAIPVVPVLIDGAPMPQLDELPEDMQMLVRRQAEVVQHRTFEADVGRLIKKLELAKMRKFWTWRMGRK
jgi:hypothetical protein